MTIVLAALLFGLGIVPIILTQRRLKLRRELPHGGYELIGFDDWCKRHLGVWWAARIAMVVYIALLGLWFGKPSGLVMAIGSFGFMAWGNIAHELGKDWAGKEHLQENYRRINKLQQDQNFMLLQRRNENLGAIFYISMFLGLIVPLIWNYYSVLYDRHDINVFWLLGLAFGLFITLPWLVISACTLPFGTSRLWEFVQYEELKNPGNRRAWPWIVAVGALLTLVSAVMIARTATF